MSLVRNATGPRHFALPPKPITLEAAYRKSHGLSELLPASADYIKPSIASFQVPDMPEPHAHSVEHYVRQLARRDLDPVERRNLAPLELQNVAPYQAMSAVLDKMAWKHGTGRINAAQWHEMLPRIKIITQRRGLRSETQHMLPRYMYRHPTPGPIRHAWIEQYQFATWTLASEHMAAGRVGDARTALVALASTLTAESYYRGHRHFGDGLGIAAIDAATAALALCNAGANTTSEDVLPAARATLRKNARAIAYQDPLDLFSLRLNPWSSVGVMREHPIIQAIAQYETFNLIGTRAALQLGEWARESSAFKLGPSETPRITMGKDAKLQSVERMVDLGTYAIREAGDDVAAVTDIAHDLWTLLGREDVYPHLAYFNSTRLAMGVLRDALRWDGSSSLEFTAPLRGFAALYRHYCEAGTDAMSMAGVLKQAIDPLEWWVGTLPSRRPLWSRALNYVMAAHAQGYFEASYAEAMQHAVTIHEPDHRAHAIVVHDDGGES